MSARETNFERIDVNQELSLKSVLNKLKIDVGIDIDVEKLKFSFGRQEDDPRKVEFMSFGRALSAAEIQGIITTFPELKKVDKFTRPRR